MVRPVTDDDTGLKVLCEPAAETAGNQGTIVDIVAIHGIGSHPDDTWCKKVGTGEASHYVNWLKQPDMLPSVVPNARIMRYGYMSRWYGDEAIRQKTSTIAQRLLMSLKRARKVPVLQSRPLIFVAYCFGGLVVLQALLNAERFADEWPGIYSATSGIVFLGTPFRGAPGLTLRELIQAVDAEYQDTIQGEILRILDPNDESLLEMVHLFEKILAKSQHRVKVACFFELKPCNVKAILGKEEKRSFAVTEGSGCLDSAMKIGLQRNHFDMNKFRKPTEEDYLLVCDIITHIVNAIPTMVSARCQSRQPYYSVKDGPIIDRTSGQEDLTCLRSLAFPEMNYRRQDTQRAYANTCGWITRHQSYTTWLEDGTGILWVMGKPGSGKSTLMEFLLRDFEKQALYQESIQLSFFLHGRGTSLQKSRLGMYRSLLHQLLLRAPTAAAEFRRAFQERSRSQGAPGKDWNWHINELRAFFMDAVEHTAKTQPVNIFVDALDEASDATDNQNTSYRIVSDFHELNDLLHHKKLRSTICFSCRHFPVVADNQGRTIHVEDENQADISVYVCDKLHRRLLVSGSEQNYLAELQDVIAKRAQGVFQWAALVADLAIRYHNNGSSPRDIRQILEKVPEELGDVYKHILSEVIDKKYCRETLRLMRWVCFAERPLTVTEIFFAMSLPETETIGLESSLAEPELQPSEVTVRRIVSLSGGLIEFKQHWGRQIVQFIHQSVNDFLLRDGLRLFDKSFGDPIGQGHHQLSLICANYMRIAEMDSSNECDAENVKDKLPFVVYVTRSWFFHAQNAETRGVPQNYLLRYSQYYPSILERWVKFYGILDRYNNYKQKPEKSSTMLHIASGTGLLSVVEGLLSTHANLEETDAAGNRALHHASRWGHAKVVKALLNAGAVFEAENDSKCTALERAAANGYEEIVKLLLNKGVYVNKQTGATGNALYGAAAKGSRAVVQLLLDNGAEVNAQGGHFSNALQAAASNSSLEIVQLLLDNKADVNAQGGRYGTALQAAVYRGSLEIVQLLLDNGAKVNAQGSDCSTALQAAVHEGSLEIVQLLLNNKANVNAQGGRYGTALQAAVYRGSLEIVQLLLNNKANVNAQGGRYGTALQAAAYRGSLEIVQLLLDNKADVNAQGSRYSNALQAAASNSSLEIVQLLLDNKANVNAQGGRYGTALQAAAYRGSLEIVQLLLDNKADVNAQGSRYSSALQAAAYRGSLEIVQLLLDNKADVNAQGGRYGSALQAAALGGSLEIVQLLLDNKADVNAQGGAYGSALQAAIKGGNQKTVQLLLENGAKAKDG